MIEPPTPTPHPTRPQSSPRIVARRRASGRLPAVLAVLVAVLAVTLTACAGPPVPAPPAAPVSTSPSPPPLARADVDAWLDGVLPASLEREGIAGATVAVVHDGSVVTTRGYGWADVEARVPVDPDRTLFRVGSVSKVVTATAVMQLVEQGRLDLDAPVADQLDFALPTRFATPITLRHLLTHTAGFEERVEGLIGGPGTTVDLRDALATNPPEQVYEPGTVPAYSNYGNALAGYLVERASGQPFESYVAEHVLAPTGMTSSTFAQPLPEPLADRMSQGYADASAAPTPFEIVGTPPAGSFTSSATDMARFMLAQLGRSPGEPLLRPETLAQQHAPALDEQSLGGLAAGPRMTLGFFDRSRNGHRIIEHGGDTTVFHSDLELYPDAGAGVFVSFNSSGTDPAATTVLRDQLLEGFADRYFPGPRQAPGPVDHDRAAEQAAAVAGVYESSRAARSTFLTAAYVVGPTTLTAGEEGRLIMSPGSGGRAAEAYEPAGPWVWQQIDGDRRIAARVVDGRVQAIGVDSAFALVPTAPERSPSLLLPVAGGSALVLLLAAVGAVIARPVRWLWRRGRPAQRSTSMPTPAPTPTPMVAPARHGRVLRVLTAVAVTSALVALVGWLITVTAIMNLGAPSASSIRSLQVLQAIGVLGIVPAVVRVIALIRRRSGVGAVLAAIMVALALVGVAAAAAVLRLLTWDISY